MNNLIESIYALRILWGYVKNKFIVYDIRKYTLTMLVVLLLLLASNRSNVIVNKVTFTPSDSYRELSLSREDKITAILENYKLTKEQFSVVCAVTLSEAQANSYEDAYAVINTIYNRTHSKNWVNSVDRRYGKGLGNSLYYQVIAPNQFTVYQSGIYKKNIGNTNNVGYDAIIDFLYSEDIMHNYLSFRSHNIKVKNSESFSDKGNNYFNILTDKNRI